MQKVYIISVCPRCQRRRGAEAFSSCPPVSCTPVPGGTVEPPKTAAAGKNRRSCLAELAGSVVYTLRRRPQCERWRNLTASRGVEAGYVHRPEIVVLPDPLPSIPGKAAPALRLECSAQTPPMAAWKTPTYAAGTRIGLAISKTRRSE